MVKAHDVMTEWNSSSRSRRLLPSTASLAAFEAVARCGSFTKAGAELALSQSAVSKQIASLEAMLNIKLFEQGKSRSAALTPAGNFYYERVRQILTSLSAATAGTISFKGNSRALRLGVPATFGSRWLIPRITDFYEKHPDISLEFATRLGARLHADFANLDVSIEFATHQDTDHYWRRLMAFDIVAVARPDVVAGLDVRTSEDLHNVPILLHISEVDLWDEWCASKSGREGSGKNSKVVVFEHFSMVLQAATAGLGVAIAPIALIERELANGDLVIPVDLCLKGPSCNLVYPKNMIGMRSLKLFEEWLIEQTNSQRYPANTPITAPS